MQFSPVMHTLEFDEVTLEIILWMSQVPVLSIFRRLKLSAQ